MTSKIIVYDLCKPGRDYDALYDAIKGLGSWARVTESTWLVSTDLSSSQIRDTLAQEMDENDRLFVGKLTGEAAWHNTRCGNEEIKKRL